MNEKDRDELQRLPPDRRENIEREISSLAQRRRKRVVWIAGGIVVVLVLMVVMLKLASRGRAIPADGTPTVARVDRAPDGNCIVGETRAHCYELHLTVFPRGASPYAAKVNVNVMDRWASRIQPGSFATVVVDKNDPLRVYLDVAAFTEPPPAPPESASLATPPVAGEPK